MFAIKSDIVWFFIFIHVSKCERRIQDGIKAKAEKPYVVYLVKAPVSRVGYDYWLCGGALVTSEFVVTSAACIKDVDYLYVIAGYNKYVTDDDIELDQCTSQKKKKVIYTCYPQGYELKYEQLDVWSLIDIGVAKVESPYDFNDQSYKTLCSYIPSMIPISYDAKYQEPGIDAVVFGWGHQFEWRKQEDRANHNQEKLNYAPVMIIDKNECKRHYAEYGQMREVIDTYMICTLEGGSLDDFGERLEVLGEQAHIPSVNGCAKRKSLAFNPDEAIEDCDEDYEYDDTRRVIKKSNHSSNNSMIKIRNKNNSNKTGAEPYNTTVSNRARLTNRSALTNRTASINRTALINRTASFEKPFISNKTVVFNDTVRDTRRYGICQNDHGGPLVTWVGAREILIGVASVFKVSETYKCTGPYLYTSTQCNGAFLDCILTKAKFDFRRSSDAGIVFNNSRRSFCRKSVDDERHPTVERHISWLYHPAGAADHERHSNSRRNGPDVNERTPAMNEEDNEMSYCSRRIKDGSEVSTDKRYIVYLVKAPKSDKLYDAWVCGGAIVNSYFIITSAACVDDVEYMYAIAGYNRYVKDNELESNKCTKAKKKKIIYICVPRAYELEYDKLDKWSLIDIALAKVESPYDFTDQSYKTLCSYIPTWIPINYEDRFQEPGTDGLVLGWGHTNKWREPSDSANYNANRLRYASTRILDKERCKANYAKFENMDKIIDKYMICTLEKGELDEKGQIVYGGTPPPKIDGCEGGLRLLSYDNEACDDDLTRREVLRSNPSNDSIINKNDTNIETKNKTKDSKNYFNIETKNKTLLNQTNESRKSGICQNDHGGPLVTWIGAREVLIGIASVFRVSDDLRCMGPYLYTSTQCNGAFLDCILSNSALPEERSRRAICDSPPIQRGFDTVERNISWLHHPAGPADNEVSFSEKKFVLDKLNMKKGVVDRLNTRAGLSKALERFMKIGKFSGNETVAIRPQRPLGK